MDKKQMAFTLIELLVVVAIIGILVSLAFPVISRIRESAKTAAAKADMQMIENALNSYYAEYKKLPAPDWTQGKREGVGPGGLMIRYGTFDVDGGGWHHSADTFSPSKSENLTKVYQALHGSNPDGLNPRKTQFLALQEGRPPGLFMDPWSKGFKPDSHPGNRPYGIFLNVSYENKIYFWPAARSSSIPAKYHFLNDRMVLARSYGPNRKEDFAFDREDFDDIYSIDTSFWEDMARD